MTTATETFEFELYSSDTPLETLVAAAQQGDRDAFGQLVERYEGMVKSVALRRLGDEAEALELAQDVFMKAMQRIDQLKEPAALGGWLRQITVRMAINRQVRRKPVVSAEPQTLEATVYESRTPLDSALTNERAQQVRGGLDRLGEMDRSTLVAFYVRGESLNEMSVAFRAPVGTIKRRLHVARKRLAAELEMLQAV
ncbi:ECF RNA polymerase sigma factor SigW [Posidoniimonas polymericola]|uniref:ECF RNA polymerase sigma factor SigW n=1 Tax=Posidoniimonas polymericola TaxID=2528002 RepID=A0A5C5YCV7_9BACT|nr:sigma-70 family RNA polymerase sigma factor [Posidoniimonas polymericola]TWT73547.1 ECF RNA polymerase sigma factor SigW [Posidoniimonas polymericola]